MAVDITRIGTFGISFSKDFDQTWFNLLRKDEGYIIEFFQNVEDEDSDEDDELINESIPVSFAQGEEILRRVFEDGHLEQWQAQYSEKDEGPATDLTWTIDVDDTEDQDMIFISGNKKLPSEGWMEAVLAAARLGEDRFMRCFKQFR